MPADVAGPGEPRVCARSSTAKRPNQGNTRDLIFDIPYLIEYLSSFMTLGPGDVILTGTPEGVRNVMPGDEVVCEIDGLGRLSNTIVVGCARSAGEREGSHAEYEHLIGGAPAAAKDYFETVNPATQEVLAEVAARRRAGSRRRRGGRQSGLPEWAGAARGGASEAAPQARRSDRGARAGDLAQTETQDTGQVIAQTGKQLDAARGGQLLLLRRDVRAGRRPYLSDADAPELHAVPPGRRVRADLPLERAVHDRPRGRSRRRSPSATPRCSR